MDDKEYNELLYFVSCKNYPKRVTNIKDSLLKKNEKKKIRSKCKDLRANDGMLYKGSQRVLRQNEVQGVLHSLHKGKFAGGHLGRDKTYDKIRKHYTWKHMKEDVRDFVKNCDKCSRVNIAPPHSAPPLNPIPVPSKVWSLVGIDIIGPYESSSSGNKYIVAATDHFSKWSVAEAIPYKSAECVSKFMLKLICTYGPMDSIITDQGKEFTNKVIDSVTSALDIEHRISSAYHPQTNGQRERDNRTLKEMLSKYVSEKGDDWDQLLDFVMFAYRTSQHSSTKLTPFNVMYGRDPKLVYTSMHKAVDSVTKEGLETLISIRNDINMKVTKNIENAQKHQKRNYDNRNKSYVAFQLGSQVLIKNANKIRRFGGKLEPRWLGPYTVVEVLSKGRVRLQNESSKKVLKNVYHSSNCKLYCTNVKSSQAMPKRKRLIQPRHVSRPLKSLKSLPNKLFKRC